MSLGPTNPPRPASSRWWQVVEAEDLLLALWFLVIESLVVRYFELSPLSWLEPRDGIWPLGFWLVTLAFLVVVFSRGSRDTSIDQAIFRRILMVGPFYLALSLIGLVVSLIRGGEKSMRRLGGGEAEWPMPAVPDRLRRLVATPILLVGDAAFQAVFEQRRLPAPGDQLDSLELLGAGFFFVLTYVIFVVGPRVAAGASGDWRIWSLRLAIYAGALFSGHRLAGLGWL